MRLIDQFQGVNNTRLVVGPGNPISQTFTAKKDNIAGIRLFLANENLGGNQEYLFTISKNGQTADSMTVTESNLGWDMVFRYDFGPVEARAGDKFKLTITSVKEEKEETAANLKIINEKKAGISDADINKLLSSVAQDELTLGNLQLSYGRKNNYTEGSAYLGEKELPGDIVFETYYQTDFASATREVFGNTAGRLLQDPAFSLFYLLLIASLLFSLIKSVRLGTGKYRKDII